ncbi:ABC transporter permease [Candidatus Babeliales bacterium]|nr:ABC transporter permease [Candidatus Babeliales bacterium]
MIKKIISQLKIFFQLIKTDLIIFKKDALGGIIDTIIWVSILLFVTSHLYPKLGMPLNYGVIYLLGTIVSCSLFETESNVVSIISDIEGNNNISYQATLPIKSNFVFLKNAISSACKAMTLAIVIIPLGKIFLWQRLNLSLFSPIKFLIMFVTIGIFAGIFSIFMSSLVKGMKQIDIVWFRVLFPLWMLGGTFFPWYAVYKLSPKFAYLFLLNPVIYASEGMRVAILGQQNYINFWLCLSAMWFSVFIFGFFGIKRLKKRLDFI